MLSHVFGAGPGPPPRQRVRQVTTILSRVSSAASTNFIREAYEFVPGTKQSSAGLTEPNGLVHISGGGGGNGNDTSILFVTDGTARTITQIDIGKSMCFFFVRLSLVVYRSAL